MSLDDDTPYARSQRLERVKKLKSHGQYMSVEDNERLRRRLLGRDFQGTTQEGGTTPTLAALGYGGHKVADEFKETVVELDESLALAEKAATLETAKKAMKSARDKLDKLTDMLQGNGDD